MENQKKIPLFGERFDTLYNCLCEIRNSKDDWRYKILPVGEFSKNDDPIEAAVIYWREMLYRAHLSVLVSFFKSLRWIDAIQDAHEKGNYLEIVLISDNNVREGFPRYRILIEDGKLICRRINTKNILKVCTVNLAIAGERKMAINSCAAIY